MKQRPMRTPMTVIALIALVAASQGCASARPPAGATPRIEVSGGVNMVQLPSAQFPGFMASVAYIVPKTPRWGIGLVADVESSYLVETSMAGARVYLRNRPLFGDERTVTGFAQLLVKEATGGVQGILRSEGGLAVTPSVGLDYGSGRRAFHLQVGYRKVSDGAVFDPRISDEPSDELSRLRVVLGMTWRFRAR